MVYSETCASWCDLGVLEEAAVGREYGFPRGICGWRGSLGVCLIELQKCWLCADCSVLVKENYMVTICGRTLRSTNPLRFYHLWS